MAGVYGNINSRLDFSQTLSAALGYTKKRLSREPDDPVIVVINKQLKAMERWTRNGREPTKEERESINIGLIAVRELDGNDDEEEVFVEHLHELNNYFEDWPSDEQAALSSEDDDSWLEDI